MTTDMAHLSIPDKLAKAPKITMHDWNRGHWYEVAGHVNPDHKKGWWPSVTGILSAGVPKPALVPWARKSAFESVRASLMEYEASLKNGLDYETWVTGVIEASKGKEDTEARDYGTAAHALISAYVTQGIEPEPDALGWDSYRAFRDWLTSSGLAIAASEFPVFHEGIAGTVDLLLYDGAGGWILADLKTGSGVYSEMAFQVSAYIYAASHMLDLNIQQGAIIHLPKTPKAGEPPMGVWKIKDWPSALVGYHAAAAMKYALDTKHFEPLGVTA